MPHTQLAESTKTLELDLELVNGATLEVVLKPMGMVVQRNHITLAVLTIHLDKHLGTCARPTLVRRALGRERLDIAGVKCYGCVGDGFGIERVVRREPLVDIRVVPVVVARVCNGCGLNKSKRLQSQRW